MTEEELEYLKTTMCITHNNDEPMNMDEKELKELIKVTTMDDLSNLDAIDISNVVRFYMEWKL